MLKSLSIQLLFKSKNVFAQRVQMCWLSKNSTSIWGIQDVFELGRYLSVLCCVSTYFSTDWPCVFQRDSNGAGLRIHNSTTLDLMLCRILFALAVETLTGFVIHRTGNKCNAWYSIGWVMHSFRLLLSIPGATSDPMTPNLKNDAIGFGFFKDQRASNSGHMPLALDK